jgi:G3E family GTPase
MHSEKIIAVPTNIITGFLGVGKTSAILHLLKNKPENERWAILVNEFGEIGVDGSLMAGEYSEQHGVYIQEVPGGCMCCAAGVSMQVALNQLLKRAKPDRLLIEPTGLGHPKEVLKVLSAEHYQTVLTLQKTITLVDARNLSEQRYTTHDIFNQQIAIADTVIGNKVDVYRDGDKEQLINYVKKHSQTNANVHFAQQGNITLSQLAGTTSLGLTSKSHYHETEKALMTNFPMPECGFIKAINTGEGFSSIGWRFSSAKVFNYRKLQAFLTHITAERIKAVFITEFGTFGYNIAIDGLTESALNDGKESRIEIISQQINESLEAQLMACIIN